MTDTDPRDLIKLLIDALKQECNWIDNPKHDELIAKATAYLTQYAPEVLADEGLNSKSSPNNLQIRSSDITPPSELVHQWRSEWIYNTPGDLDELGFLASCGAQWGADQELEACVDWISKQDWTWTSAQLRAARRPQPPSLKEQSLKHLEVMERDGYYLPEILQDLRRALEQLDD